MKRKLELTFVLLVLVGVLIFSRRLGKMVSEEASGEIERVDVIIDAGHGGDDPGKIGINQALEKDINLQIAKKVEKLLKERNISCKMTRTEDVLIAPEGSKQKKIEDMKERVRIINETKPVVAVSIHQNSYHEEYVSGGQVFYYKTSEKGKYLAEILQKRFDYVLGEANKRMAKANDNYYLLLHVKEPIVIVECGFLSNGKEAKRLEDEEYQDRMAWTIHMGIMEYLNTVKQKR